jgi:hypothetical protein
MMEAVLISAAVLKHFRLEFADEKRVLKPEPLVSLRIKNGIHMTAFKR